MMLYLDCNYKVKRCSFYNKTLVILQGKEAYLMMKWRNSWLKKTMPNKQQQTKRVTPTMGSSINLLPIKEIPMPLDLAKGLVPNTTSVLARNVIPMHLVLENGLEMTTLLAWAKNQMILMLLDLENEQ